MKVRDVVLVTMMLSATGSACGAWLAVGSGGVGESPVVTVQQASENAWEMEISVPGLLVETVNQSGASLSQLSMPGELTVGEAGHPELPAIARLVALRNIGDPTIEAVYEDWVALEQEYDLSVVQDEGSVTLIEAVRSRDAYFPSGLALITSRQMLGEVPLALVQFSPVRYDPVQRRVEVLRNARFRIQETGEPFAFERPITETTASVLRAIVPNWDEMGLDEFVVRGTFLYIVANNSDVQSEIQNLVTWRTRKGYRVEVAGPAQIPNWTNSGVKSYIQGRFNSANPPLEFVCLVGDANGSYTVPYYTYGGGAGDWDYSRLNGNDNLPDVAVGRLCFASTAELNVIVNKVLNYERDPVAPSGGTHPNWYKGAGLFCGSGSGTSPVETLRWVRERLLENGYTSSSIDTVYYLWGSVGETQINNSINAGVSVWWYRGYLGMSGYESNNLSGLLNGRRLPFLLSLTCGTNDFSGDDITERFVRTANKGAVAAIGMSTSGTHTRFNNILMSGAAQGLLREGTYTTGATLMRAKVELYRNYPTDSSNVAFFSGITTLIGEPAVDVFTDTPDTLFVNNPATAPIGTNNLNLHVTNTGGLPVAGAYVQLVKGTEVFVGGRTNSTGDISLNFVTTTAETLFVTASKHNHRPAINYTRIISSAQFVSPASGTFTLDDDLNGSSNGNADGRANPGETIELAIPLKNWGTSSAGGVQATLSSSDPLIASIPDNVETYGTIAAGATVNPADDFDFTVAGYASDGYSVEFTLTVTDDAAHSWSSRVPVRLSNGNFEYQSHTLTGVGNGILDPYESGGMWLYLINNGQKATPANATAYLRSENPAVTVTDSVGVFLAAAVGGQSHNQGNTFGLQATGRAYPGESVPLSIIFPLGSGFADTVRLTLTIGSIASTAPTPPDAYGYWAFDNTDVNYPKHPTYGWIEIDPRYGGAGTAVNIVDNGEGEDDNALVNLPFTFSYYGQDYTQIVISSNGWIAMGADEIVHTDFRNYSIPSASGPSKMIAAFWDDLLVPPAAQVQDDRRGNNPLDEGGEGCASAVLIPSLPYTDTGNTSDNDNTCGGTSRDVFYRYTVPAGGQTITVSLCGSSYDTWLRIYGGSCCGTELGSNDDFCGLSSEITRAYNEGDIWIMVEGYGSSSGAYTMSVTGVTPPEPAGIYTYYDVANHRFIVEWSRVQKYDGAAPYPEETFQCILFEPGYPSTPTGDGEILFQYLTCNNTGDDYQSNDYCTVGIENADQTGGVLYSYYNRVSPNIPGAATLTAGRAILFTTQKLPVDTPMTPTGLVILRVANDNRLNWNRVTTDIHGTPLPAVDYRLYRGTVPNFPLDGTTLLATVSDTVYTDANPALSKYFYAVTAAVPGAAASPAESFVPAVHRTRE